MGSLPSFCPNGTHVVEYQAQQGWVFAWYYKQDTIWIDKAVSDAETPWHNGKKKKTAKTGPDMAGDQSGMQGITDEARKLGRGYIGRSQYRG